MKTLKHLIEYTIARVGQMQIADRYKIELLGLLSAMQYRVEEKDETDRRGQGAYQDREQH